jgi:hypothetical protein
MNGTELSSMRSLRSGGGLACSAAVCGGVHAQPSAALASSAATVQRSARLSGSIA